MSSLYCNAAITVKLPLLRYCDMEDVRRYVVFGHDIYKLSIYIVLHGPINDEVTLTLLTFLLSAAERARQRRIIYMSRPGIRSRSMALPMNADAMT